MFGWMLLAVAGPALLAFNRLPSTTFYNQALACFGWGAVVLRLAGSGATNSPPRLDRGSRNLLLALGLLFVAASAGWAWQGLPSSLTLGALTLLVSAAVVLSAGRRAINPSRTSAAVLAFFAALALAGVLNAAIAVLQYVSPGDADPGWIVRRVSAFRVVGNLRQPNLLALQLVWAVIGLALLAECRRLPVWLAGASAAACLLGVAMSGSRMGALLIVLLAAWGAFDRQLSAATRRRLLIAPLVYGAAGLLLYAWAHAGGSPFSGEAQLTKADLSSSRLGLWRQTLQLIASSPWQGVGWGQFNFAWTLTPMTRFSGYTFTHSHNLLLQWAAEMGLPMAGALVLLVGSAAVTGWRRMRMEAASKAAPVRGAALLVVVSALLHSLSEFPLWYAHFLLPVMFAFGIAVAPGPDNASGKVDAARRPVPGRYGQTLRACGWVMVLGAALAVYDYQRIAAVYAPHDLSDSDEQRIANGRRSIFYGHVADRFAGIITRPGERSLEPFVRGTRDMLDMRLLIAWSLALHEAGDTDRARFIAQRVREFDDPIAKRFFERCLPAQMRPFQCDAPTGRYSFRDFRP